jgi:TorA maturation chaperone TorD
MDVHAAQPLAAEDQARAQWYGLISRLFHAAPDAMLLDAIALAAAGNEDEGAGSPFYEAWRDIQAACAGADAENVRTEFEALFVGVGKALVTPYTSAYAAPHAPDRHLVALRERFGEWGLGRRDGIFETEDHISAVCDGMRWLIEHGRSLAEQREYFSAYVDAAMVSFCTAINQAPSANFYRNAAALALAFHAVEKDAFDMHTET